MCLAFTAAVLATGCGGNAVLAPVGREPQPQAREYVVQRGDTLYYVAWRFAKDWAEIARNNGLVAPYTIQPGQRLRLERRAQTITLAPIEPATRTTTPSATPAPAAEAAGTAPSSSPATSKTTPGDADVSKRTATPAPSPRTARADVDDDAAVTRWGWPARGPVLAAFGSSGGNGIEIGGTRGDPILASAPGTVVYSGSGLIGYGKLIIIKHNKSFLSAYAHNDNILVDEGERVDIGQQIAQMGSSGAERVKLHFEIRRDGKPVDPKRYLPK
ncbi:MAG: peptidoglycan DD-metalloendopeptidase family protein [Planctomycetes bacterium]|nr:peptidoglycan DD-metalloendopeptidase family protein [Planctomycetota bacterium]